MLKESRMLHPKIQHVTVCLFILSFRVQSELICSDQPIVALNGDDVILSCHFEPPIDVSSEMVFWIKPGLDSYVHVHHDGQTVTEIQNPSYNFRTKLFEDELKNGNVSLKILNVKLSDEGQYVCKLPSVKKRVSIQLSVVQSELICSDQPIVALAGDDVILPCHLEPPINVSSETVFWIRPDLDSIYVHVHHDGQTVTEIQNPSYNFRTKLFVDELKNGNVSLKILNVKLSDEGQYVCKLPSMKTRDFIQLSVGVVSRPVIEILSKNDTEVVLLCKSEGWYPEPEVSWLDSEGHVLSAGPTETVRGPDGLYNISSRLTVEERHSNNFTCRVQLKNINQSRETQIHVPDDSPSGLSSSDLMWIIIIISLVFVDILIILCLIKIKYLKRKWETLIHSFNDRFKRDEENIPADSPELSRLTEQETEPENRRTTVEGGQSADQQTEPQEEETTD